MPIALIVNVIRIVVTGLMYLHVSSQTASVFFHDLAGWFMMPMALAFLWVGAVGAAAGCSSTCRPRPAMR